MCWLNFNPTTKVWNHWADFLLLNPHDFHSNSGPKGANVVTSIIIRAFAILSSLHLGPNIKCPQPWHGMAHIAERAVDPLVKWHLRKSCGTCKSGHKWRAGHYSPLGCCSQCLGRVHFGNTVPTRYCDILTGLVSNCLFHVKFNTLDISKGMSLSVVL